MKCGFIYTVVETVNDLVTPNSGMETLFADSGVAWEDYANCNNEM